MPSIINLLKVFKTLTRSIEAFLVVKGLKPVARMAFFEADVGPVKAFCNANGLHCFPSIFKVRMEFSGNYSTKGRLVGKEEQGHLFLYISKSKKLALKARECEQKQDFRGFGRLLGYPECCIDFFVKNRPSESKKQNDYVLPALENSSGFVFSYLNNVFGRYFDKPLVFHAPCSFDCKKTQLLSKKYLQAIKSDDEQLFNLFIAFLKSAVVYSPKNVALINYTKADVEGGVIEYSRVFATRKDELYTYLIRNKKLMVSKEGFMTRFSFPVLLFV